MFNVITPIFKSDTTCLHLSIQAFEAFYDEITPKHRKKVKLILILNSIQQETYSNYTNTAMASKAIEIIPENEVAVIDKNWEQASLCFLPDSGGTTELFNKSLFHHLPVLTFASKLAKKTLDNSCSLLIPFKLNSQDSVFAQKLKMLYFDPGARKMLTQGAMKKWKMMNHLVEKSN
jgi:hypothetical protein